MGVVLVEDKVVEGDIKTASEEYDSYIKIVVDIKTKDISIGGEWHADGEKLLIENGSKQSNLWGGGIDIDSKKIDHNSLINIRPNANNDSMEILDSKIKDVFDKIVEDKFNL